MLAQFSKKLGCTLGRKLFKLILLLDGKSHPNGSLNFEEI
jgi:hypothetical protein